MNYDRLTTLERAYTKLRADHDALRARVDAQEERLVALETAARLAASLAEESAALDDAKPATEREAVVAAFGAMVRPLIGGSPAELRARMLAAPEMAKCTPADFMDAVADAFPKHAKPIHEVTAMAREHAVTWADLGIGEGSAAT